MLKRDAEGTVKRVENAKVAVFAQGVDTTSTETKVNTCSLCQPKHTDDRASQKLAEVDALPRPSSLFYHAED